MMSTQRASTEAARIRSALDHPVIDVDGHHLELLPALDEYLREGMGSILFDSWRHHQGATIATLAERQVTRAAQPGWWTGPPVGQAEYRAAASLPRLLRDRMDDFGIDFMVLYTSAGLGAMIDPQDDIRTTFCWSLNEFYADHYLPYHDRMTPAGVIPMFSPDEALAEIDHCHALGLKVAHLPHGVPRPIQDVHASSPSLYPRVHWLDTFGVDSEYDYDPVWRRLADLGFAATFHGHSSHAASMKSSRSVTNYVFNHIGAHASLMSEVCKSLLVGGVTHRFPSLPFAFLEGGIHWATGLLQDFVGHWERRNIEAIRAHDPRDLDVGRMQGLFEKWGSDFQQPSPRASASVFANRRESPSGDTAEPQSHDDFVRCGVRSLEDIARLFDHLYFGCEADDPMLRIAFQGDPTSGVKLRPLFSSDFGHWDAGVADRLLPNGHALVVRGMLSSGEFRNLMADNAIRLHGTLNPLFWSGTAVATYADTVLRRFATEPEGRR